MWDTVLEVGFNSFLLLFVTIDPVGVTPMFAALGAHLSELARRRAALQGVMLAAIILIVFGLTGDRLLGALGIGLPAFRIAGGGLLFLLAIDMVFARRSGLRSTTQGEFHEAEQRDDISVFPLAFPLLAGPGALTTILLMTTGQRGDPMLLGVVFGALAHISHRGSSRGRRGGCRCRAHAVQDGAGVADTTSSRLVRVRTADAGSAAATVDLR